MRRLTFTFTLMSIILLALVTIGTTTATGPQVDRIKDSIKRSKDAVKPPAAPVPESPPTTTTSPTAQGSAMSHGYKPAVNYESLMKVRYYPNQGNFLAESLHLVFPPPDDQPAELIIRKAGGGVVARVPLRIERWEMPAFAAFYPNGVPGTLQVGQPGDYVMAVKLGAEEITTMPFTLKVVGSTDPFNPQKTLVREGPWRTMAYLSIVKDRPDEPLRFNLWVSQQEVSAAKNTQQKLTLHLMRGSQEVATGDLVLSWDDWTFHYIKLQESNRRGFWPFKPSMLTDGSYTILYKVNGQTIRSFPFEVKGGQIQRMARNELGYKPHTDFISPRILMSDSRTMEETYWVQAKE